MPYKIYNEILKAYNSEFRLKPQGDKLTLVTKTRQLINREVPVTDLAAFVILTLLKEFGQSIALRLKASSASHTSVNLNGSTHCSSGDFMTGILIGGLFL